MLLSHEVIAGLDITSVIELLPVLYSIPVSNNGNDILLPPFTRVMDERG
jgi:hypothetical protein